MKISGRRSKLAYSFFAPRPKKQTLIYYCNLNGGHNYNQDLAHGASYTSARSWVVEGCKLLNSVERKKSRCQKCRQRKLAALRIQEWEGGAQFSLVDQLLHSRSFPRSRPALESQIALLYLLGRSGRRWQLEEKREKTGQLGVRVDRVYLIVMGERKHIYISGYTFWWYIVLTIFK